MHRKWLLIAAVIVVVALAGCSKPAQPATTSTATPTPSTPSTATAPQVIKTPPAKGVALVPLAEPPGPGTIGALKKGELAANSAFDVVVKPYGFGPTALQGPTVVVKIDSIKSAGKKAVPSYLREANLVVVMDEKAGGNLTVGGEYAAVVTFVADSDRLVPMLSKVSPR